MRHHILGVNRFSARRGRKRPFHSRRSEALGVVDLGGIDLEEEPLSEENPHSDANMVLKTVSVVKLVEHIGR